MFPSRSAVARHTQKRQNRNDTDIIDSFIWMDKYFLHDHRLFETAQIYNPRACFKTIKVTKQGYRQGKQQNENKAPFSHTELRNDGDF